jgi:hypothetical protein
MESGKNQTAVVVNVVTVLLYNAAGQEIMSKRSYKLVKRCFKFGSMAYI